MKAALISFSQKGLRLANELAEFLNAEGLETTVAVKSVYAPTSIQTSVHEWTKEQFYHQDALIFVGAAGIAVRAVGPLAKDKRKDAAVLVIDEKGKYCIPILSGHIGGANALAKRISKAFSMEAVLTTATDVENMWAVDVFAVNNGLDIEDMKKAKNISARLLRGERLTYQLDAGVQILGKCPKELSTTFSASQTPQDIYSGIYQSMHRKETLCLIPKVVVLGIGCKKGTPFSAIEQTVNEAILNADVCKEAICAVASIDLKAEEEGIRAYCEKYRLPFLTYSAEELMSVSGDFTASDFVKKTTGVDNVCERSAVCGAFGGRCISKKYARRGVTAAFAVKLWEVNFE